MQTVLILGASGLFGSHCAEAFATAGWQVRRYQRGTDMATAAKGADVIVNGLNPPMYHDWKRQIPAITGQVLDAARASGATVIVPGNVYVYGAQPGPWGPATPHRPNTRKGAIRAAMEAAYARAAQCGMQVIVLRGGDFLAPSASNSFLNMVVLKDLAKGRIASAGRPETRRAYAFLPDMARAAVALATRRADLPAFTDLPFPGLTFSIRDLQAEITRQTGRALKVTGFPWWLMTLAAPVWELARELREMRYLFDLNHSLDPGPFEQALPGFALSQLPQVVAAHLAARPA